MADKSTQMILDALSRAVADPAGVPLHGGKAAPGLFAGNAPGKQAAQRCKDEGYLRVVRTETRGKAVQEICALTDKGLAYLLGQVSPRQVLEDFVRALEARQAQVGELVAIARQIQAGLDALKSTAETVLQSVGSVQTVVNARNGDAPANGKTATTPSAHRASRRPTWTRPPSSRTWRSGTPAAPRKTVPLPELYRAAPQHGARADHRPFPRRPAPAPRTGPDLPAPLDRPALRHSRAAVRPARRPRDRLLRQLSQG